MGVKEDLKRKLEELQSRVTAQDSGAAQAFADEAFGAMVTAFEALPNRQKSVLYAAQLRLSGRIMEAARDTVGQPKAAIEARAKEIASSFVLDLGKELEVPVNSFIDIIMEILPLLIPLIVKIIEGIQNGDDICTILISNMDTIVMIIMKIIELF